MHVDHNMHVIGCNMHVTCTLFRIGDPQYRALVRRGEQWSGEVSSGQER